MNIQIVNDRIEWICDKCERPIADGEGIVCCDEAAASDRHRRVTDFDEAHGPDMSIAELLARPQDTPWQALHNSCLPEDEVGPYGFGVQRIRTPWEMLAWTEHLLAIHWIYEDTDWLSVVKHLAAVGGSPTIPEPL